MSWKFSDFLHEFLMWFEKFLRNILSKRKVKEPFYSLMWWQLTDVYFTRTFRDAEAFAVRRFVLRQLNSFPTSCVIHRLHRWNRCTIGRLVRTNRRLAHDPRWDPWVRARARDLHLLNKGVSRCNWVRCRKYGARTCYSAGREPCSRFLIKPVVIAWASARPVQNRPRAQPLFASAQIYGCWL